MVFRELNRETGVPDVFKYDIRDLRDISVHNCHTIFIFLTSEPKVFTLQQNDFSVFSRFSRKTQISQLKATTNDSKRL